MQQKSNNIDYKKILKKSYKLLEPFSNKQKWEFDNELSHLRFIANRFDTTPTILDAGCGIGLLGVSLSLLGYNVFGIDKYVFKEWKGEDISKLKSVWESVGFKVDNGDILSDAQNSQYDLVVSIAVFEHQKYPKLFMDSLLKMVKNDGLLYVATPNVSNLLNRFRMLLGRAPMSNIKNFFEEGKNFYGHWREYTLDELKIVFNFMDLEIIEAQTVQASLPRINISKWQTFYRSIFQAMGGIVPLSGDTNRILGRKT